MMERYNKGNIFLLELVVDYVHLDYTNKNDYLKNAETCVTFSFLNNGPIYVRENEFRSNTYPAENDYIKYGKSCLFSLSPAKMADSLNDFDVIVGVYKIVHSNGKPEMVVAGRTTIPLVHLYQELMSEIYMKKSSGVISKNLDGCFDLMNDSYQSTGRINLFLRITCYGKVLVSNIQMDIKDNKIERSRDEQLLRYVTAAEPNAVQYSHKFSSTPNCQTTESMYSHSQTSYPKHQRSSYSYPQEISQFMRTAESDPAAYDQWTEYRNYRANYNW